MNKKLFIPTALLVSLFVWAIVVRAADTGATFPGTCTALNTGAATDWTNPTNAQTDNDTGSTWTTGSASDVLACTNFGFSIPAGATINGIIVNIKGWDAGGGNGFVSSVRLTTDGTTEEGDNNSADDVTDWSNTAYEIKEYGNSTDLWGLSLDANDINASTFGVTHRSAKASAALINIDYMTITVYYTEAPPATAATGQIRSAQVQVRSGTVYLR